MTFYSSVEEMMSVYAGMKKPEREQAKKVFAYLIMRDLENDIEATDIFKLLNPKQ